MTLVLLTYACGKLVFGKNHFDFLLWCSTTAERCVISRLRGRHSVVVISFKRHCTAWWGVTCGVAPVGIADLYHVIKQSYKRGPTGITHLDFLQPTTPSVDEQHALPSWNSSQLTLMLRWGVEFRLWYFKFEF